MDSPIAKMGVGLDHAMGLNKIRHCDSNILGKSNNLVNIWFEIYKLVKHRSCGLNIVCLIY